MNRIKVKDQYDEPVSIIIKNGFVFVFSLMDDSFIWARKIGSVDILEDIIQIYGDSLYTAENGTGLWLESSASYKFEIPLTKENLNIILSGCANCDMSEVIS